jgi:hypothetical protein
MAAHKLLRWERRCTTLFTVVATGYHAHWISEGKGALCRGADKSLAFTISYFPICITTKRIFLGWVKEVRTTKS